jgi:hypothetical protein
MKRMKLLFTLALPVFLLQNAQAQTTMSRLIAKADWSNNLTTFVLQDTTNYTYSDGRGGDLTHPMMFDVSQSWIATDTSLENGNVVNQTFDPTTGVITSATYMTWSAFSGIYIDVSKVLYFYNNSAMPTQLTSIVSQVPPSSGSTAWVNASQDVYTYDAYGHLFSDEYDTWVAGSASWNKVSEKQYSYTVAGKVQTETDMTFTYYSGVGYVPTNTALYTYSYTGTSGTWLATKTYSTYSSGIPTPSYVYTNTYDSLGDMLTQTYQTYVMGSPVNSTLKAFSGFSSMLPTMEVDSKWDTTAGGRYDTTTMWMYTYNSFNQMTQSVGESWNVAGFWEFAYGDPMHNYWYDTYTPHNAGVKNVTNENGTVNVFPNPTQSTININLTWNEPQAFSVAIFDMKGAVVSTWSVPATAQYNTSVSVDNFNTGVYVVRIAGSNGTITREVVVAH